MVRLVWIGDGNLDALGEAERVLLDSGALLLHAQPSHSSFANIVDAGYQVRPLSPEGAPDPSVILYPGDGPGPALPLYQLVSVVDRLLGPGGCPWDQAQTHESLKRHLLEEAYEVLEAIDSGSDAHLQEELGDLLLQPIVHAQMKRAAGAFDIDRVANGIVEKLVRRHPHVFGTVEAADSDAVLKNWDAIKKAEKGGEPQSILQGVPKGMASLLRAFEVSKRAARAGFEWPDIEAVFDKLHEEEAELREALASGEPKDIESEVGDLLFTAVNIARWAGVEPEEALRAMLDRFTKRFMKMEELSSIPLGELSPGEWDVLWRKSKELMG